MIAADKIRRCEHGGNVSRYVAKKQEGAEGAGAHICGMPVSLTPFSDGWLALHLGLALGLSLFLGLAYEEFYGDSIPQRPGGIRTYPLLAIAGALLYLLDPQHLFATIAGLLLIGLWTAASIREALRTIETSRATDGLYVTSAAAVLAYVLGPAAFVVPPWLLIAVVVVAALLLSARTTLRELAARFGHVEMVTAAKFLVLSGVVLPLLHGLPAIPGTGILPFNIWLAVVAVSALSYASYLVQRYVTFKDGTLVPALLGGMYSSTAATVALARTAAETGFTADLSGGIVAASSIMYLRIIVVVAIFNIPLAERLAPSFVALALVGGILAAAIVRYGDGIEGMNSRISATYQGNPLQISTALVFAALFVVISLLTTWVQTAAGQVGLFALAAVVGVTDVDPFVLSIAQHHATAIALAPAAAAILIAASSNNVLKAVYAYAFSRRRASWLAATVLLLLAGVGVATALVIFR